MPVLRNLNTISEIIKEIKANVITLLILSCVKKESLKTLTVKKDTNNLHKLLKHSEGQWQEKNKNLENKNV